MCVLSYDRPQQCKVFSYTTLLANFFVSVCLLVTQLSFTIPIEGFRQIPPIFFVGFDPKNTNQVCWWDKSANDFWQIIFLKISEFAFPLFLVANAVWYPQGYFAWYDFKKNFDSHFESRGSSQKVVGPALCCSLPYSSLNLALPMFYDIAITLSRLANVWVEVCGQNKQILKSTW